MTPASDVTGRLRSAFERAARRDAFWIVLLTLALLAVELSGALVATAYTYDRQDNFEYFTPMIAAAHGELLSGRIPVWNPHQHLGESFLANTQMGTFYPPYTLAYWLVQSSGVDWKWLCWWIAVPHLLFGAAGYYALLRHFSVRPSLAFVASVALASAGYLRAVAPVWIFLAPTFGWLPYTLLGASHLIEGSRRVRHAALFVAGLVAQAVVGHPQILVYVWVAVSCCALAYATALHGARRKRLRALGPLVLYAAPAALISAVPVLPLFLHTANTVRKTPVAFDEFVHASVTPHGLLGLLLPVFNVKNGFVVREACSLMLHQAAWLLPALTLAAFVWARAERRGGPGRELGRVVAAFAAAGLLLLVFSLGRHAGLYSLTYAIPVWASFRWPHKFLIVALPCLGIAGGLALELLAREIDGGKKLRFATSALFVALAAAGFVFGVPAVLSRPYAQVGLLCALVLLVLAPFVASRAVRAVLGVASLGSAVMMAGLGQTYSPFVIDEPHILDSARYAPGGQYRILPVDLNHEREHMVQRMLYQNATMLGIDSVTGCTTSMAPDWFLRWLPANTRGLLPERVYRELLPSHFLRSLNVQVAVAPRNNRKIRGWLEKAGFELQREQGAVSIYVTDDTLPRAYFASQVLPYSADEFRRGLWQNQADPRTAYVEGATLHGPAPGQARVLQADFSRGDRPSIDVDSERGGFLVVSMSYDHSWRARVDGVETPLFRTNAMLQGLVVPEGRHRVTLHYESRPLAFGFLLAGLGVALLGALWIPPAWKRRAADR